MNIRNKTAPRMPEMIFPLELDESSEEEINIKYIIKHKPSPKIVRDFLKTNICTIKSNEEELFDELGEETE